MIKRCIKCGNDDRPSAAAFQNERYGKGNRVHNPIKSVGEKKCRCTICGTERKA